MVNEISIISEEDIKNKIYVIRGLKVMLDSDLAKIYGYETKDFNRQVKNNIERFDEDFRFQLTNKEIEYLSRCKNFTAMQIKGIKGGRTSNPYAFTEEGIYMLMTVLKYDNLTVINNESIHDRFIIIDKEIGYHLGSSIKDIGKKCSYIDMLEDEELNKLLIIISILF